MKDMKIRLPDELHRRLMHRRADTGKSITALVVELLEAEVARPVRVQSDQPRKQRKVKATQVRGRSPFEGDPEEAAALDTTLAKRRKGARR